MSGKNSGLLGAYKTLQSISEQANHVQVTCPGFKFGPTVLSLDARMRSVHLERSGEQLVISRRTSEGLEDKMSLKDDATYQRSLILSPEDPRISKFKYTTNDKFLLRDQNGQWETWEWDMRKELEGHQVIVQVASYEIDLDGAIGYRLHFVMPSYNWHWWVPPEMLENDFIYLGKRFERARFVLLDD